MPEVVLAGCTPEPLMSYLKTLGVFRIVAEQMDPAAKLSWRGSVARLHGWFGREELTEFFVKEYRPTPVVTPWNGGSGFYRNWDSKGQRFRNREAVDRVSFVRQSDEARLASYRKVLSEIDETLARYASPIDVRSMPEKERKATLLLDEAHGIVDANQTGLLPHLRATLPDETVEWLDTALLLQADETRAAPLFISGGNDGNFDFSVTFIGFLQTLFSAIDKSRPWLCSSLFGEGLTGTDAGTAGHFNPGGMGGPNGGQGFDGDSAVNPWDFVLLIEGALLLAGAITRRFGVQSGDKLAFPFCVSPVAAGFGSAASIDETSDGCRTEMWLPLWSNYASLPELRYLFAEGRAQLGRRQARNAVDFALATCLLGVSRGIESFVRFGFLRRSGKMFLAVPLGRLVVTPRPSASLLDDQPLTEWVGKLRSACRDKEKTPARYQTALRQIDRAMFAFASRSESGEAADRRALVDVMRAVGCAERTLATGLAFCKDKYIRPIQGLSPQWLDQANDDSIEFRLAASLAGIRDHRKVGPLRVFLEEVEMKGNFANWSPGTTSAVWSGRPLAANLAAVFRRRQMEEFREGLPVRPREPLRPARLSDVISFLREEIDDDKLHDLLWGLIAIDWPKIEKTNPDEIDTDIPFEFGAPRMLLQSRSFVANHKKWNLSIDSDSTAKPDPEVFHILSSGQPTAVEQCVDKSARRLKSGGLIVTGYRNRQQAGKPLGVQSSIPADRLLASMLFPLSNRDIERIANSVLYPPETEELS